MKVLSEWETGLKLLSAVSMFAEERISRTMNGEEMRPHALLSTLFVILATAASCWAQSPPEVAAILPDAPEPQPYVVASQPTPTAMTRPTAGFFTFRKSPNDPPLRTVRQTLGSKSILISHALGFAAMAVACSRHKTSGEEWGSEVPGMAGMAALDLLVSDRFFSRSFAVFPMGYMVFHYTKAALR